jgi:peptidoglycan/xylan/chitin deacetylase (PgdA/CDA1 family)
MVTSFSYKVYILLLIVVGVINRLFSSKSKLSVILCYHDVSDDGWTFSVSIDKFKRQISQLSRSAKIVSLRELLSSKSSKITQIALTFDDGYQGVYINAFPILNKNKFQGTVFVVGNPDLNIKAPIKSDFLKISQIQQLKKNGWEIGWHANNHLDLTTLNNSELKGEIYTSRKKYEQAIGFKIDFLAYPFGRYNKRLLKKMSEFNYSAAFTVDGNKYNADTNFQYQIPRVTITDSMSPQVLDALISPLGLLVNRLFTNIWRIKDNLSIK